MEAELSNGAENGLAESQSVDEVSMITPNEAMLNIE